MADFFNSPEYANWAAQQTGGIQQMTSGAPSSPTAMGQLGDWFQGTFNSAPTQGQGAMPSNAWGNFGSMMQGIGAVGGLFLGGQQLGMAKDQFAQTQKNWEMNYANQRQLTNQQLLDRQRARSAASSSYAKPDSAWEKENLIK